IYKAGVRLLKTEDGKKRHVTISRLTDAAPTVAAGSAPPPQTGYAAAAVPRAPSVPTPAPVPHTPTDDPWAALERQYSRAQRLALKAWGEEFDPQALVAATATIWI